VEIHTDIFGCGKGSAGSVIELAHKRDIDVYDSGEGFSLYYKS